MCLCSPQVTCVSGFPQVTCILMPIEIGWAATVQWLAGDFLCRVLLVLRVFGLYLSNFILVCISIDR